jgi:protein TonB
MPLTYKDSSAIPTEKPLHSRENSSGSEESYNSQPVALEVPVTVNGVRAIDGSDKREPFSETTSTVLVLSRGGVIRLSSSVAPGQLLFLTNEKTRKEVVCQVVKSKNYRNVSGYVELEFTEPVLGFWGLRFPGDRLTAPASMPVPVAPKSESAPLAPAAIPAKGAEPTPISPVGAKSATEGTTAKLADAVQKFKTEIKADSRPLNKADLLAPTEPSINGLKLEANRLQEQLSSLLFAEQKQGEAKPAVADAPRSKQELSDHAAKVLDIDDEQPSAAKVERVHAKPDLGSSPHAAPKNTQAPTKSSFDDEEVKIPAWLEPLARNAAIPAPPAEEGSSDEEWQAPVLRESASAPKQVAAKNATSASMQTPVGPVFGNSLLGESTPELSKSRGGNKGIWIAIAAGLIAAAASGAWYFQGSLAPTHSTSGSNASPVSSAASASLPSTPPANSAALVTAAVTPVATPSTSAPMTKMKSASAATETLVPSATASKIQPAAITERIPKPGLSSDIIKAPEKSAEPVEPEIKKSSLGAVRLAKPKMGRSAGVQANSEMEPSLEGGSEAFSAGENSLGASFATNSKQPTAPASPVQVGGDVKPARIISSVAPVYPALAKTQHVAGDVRVDALIDATGRVTTMKVVSGPSLLHQAAMDALRQWKYQAALLDGKPVPMHLTVTIQFRLQ